jgi:hypothetical protein
MRPIAWLGLMLVALALALFSVAMAGPLEDGDAAFKRSDYATALALLRPRPTRSPRRSGWRESGSRRDCCSVRPKCARTF